MVWGRQDHFEDPPALLCSAKFPFWNPGGCDIPRQPELQIAGEPVLVEINIQGGTLCQGKGTIILTLSDTAPHVHKHRDELREGSGWDGREG